MKKKKKKKYIPPHKILQKECEELWKEIIALRDGKMCMVKKFFPEIALHHTEVYQADHCFTRGNKHLFFRTSNGTMVCSACNMAKHYDNKSVKRGVDYIVFEREGKEVFDEMLKIDMSMSANVNWNKVWWLEEIKEGLLKEREERLNPPSHSASIHPSL